MLNLIIQDNISSRFPITFDVFYDSLPRQL